MKNPTTLRDDEYDEDYELSSANKKYTSQQHRDDDYIQNENKIDSDIKKFDPDDEFRDECGYTLVKALRGKTAGRKLKRTLFKFGCIQLFCGFSLFVLTISADDTFQGTSYFNNPTFGASLLDLLWCVSFPTFLMSFITFLAVKNWASLTSNRKLLGDTMKIYMAAFFLIFCFSVWCLTVNFLTFSKIRDFGTAVPLALMKPYYVSIIIFLTPYVAATIIYVLNISGLVSEIEIGGIILEPDPPLNALNLSDVTVLQTCVFICAMPCVLCIQFMDLIGALRRVYQRYYNDRIGHKYFTNSAKTFEAEPKKKKGILRRAVKTIMKWFLRPRRTSHTISPEVSRVPTNDSEQALSALSRDREEIEKLEREKLRKEREEEERKRLNEQRDAEMRLREESERKRLQEMEEERLRLLEADRLELERKRKEEELEEAERQRQMEDEFKPVLSINQFKSLWSSLGTAGSFQCKLKAIPTVDVLTAHLKKQGFHIVFASNPNAYDSEVGICNIRFDRDEKYFMARFLISSAESNFSAVMKSEQAEKVTQYVKKFALAKVLKIDSGTK